MPVTRDAVERHAVVLDELDDDERGARRRRLADAGVLVLHVLHGHRVDVLHDRHVDDADRRAARGAIVRLASRAGTACCRSRPANV